VGLSPGSRSEIRTRPVASESAAELDSLLLLQGILLAVAVLGKPPAAGVARRLAVAAEGSLLVLLDSRRLPAEGDSPEWGKDRLLLGSRRLVAHLGILAVAEVGRLGNPAAGPAAAAGTETEGTEVGRGSLVEQRRILRMQVGTEHLLLAALGTVEGRLDLVLELGTVGYSSG